MPEDKGVMLPDTRTVESGELLVDKKQAWKALLLATYMQVQTDFFDKLVSW